MVFRPYQKIRNDWFEYGENSRDDNISQKRLVALLVKGELVAEGFLFLNITDYVERKEER